MRRSVAVAGENDDGRADHGYVRVTVAIEIPRHEAARIHKPRVGIDEGSLEGSIAVAQKYPDTSGIARIQSQQVGLAVFVEVRQQ